MLIKELVFSNIKASEKQSASFEQVEECPMCRYAISPVIFYGKMFNSANTLKLSLLQYCNHCHETFISQYSNGTFSPQKNSHVFPTLDFSAPNKFEKKSFDNHIEEISPLFAKIYNQAYQAENEMLDEIAGIGYRKALEFLIKDYCKFKNPNDTDKILSAHLGDCINKYIGDERIKNLAKVSSWIGNDETHYVRKFEDKDIKDLKKFINTTVYFILYNLNVDEANDIVNAQTK